MKLSIADYTALFELVPLRFTATQITNVFAQKNNRTVEQTIIQPRYRQFYALITQKYAHALPTPLGTFLYHCKLQHDPLYRQFLNRYGDSVFCTFCLDDPIRQKQKGLYAFALDATVVYLGRCRDAFGRRINQGYGRIHPKNCYLDGQSTNCHLNALIAQHQAQLTFYVHPMRDDDAIIQLERDLIQTYTPAWNIALKRTSPGV